MLGRLFEDSAKLLPNWLHPGVDGAVIYETEKDLEQVGRFSAFEVPADVQVQFASKDKRTCLHASGSSEVANGHEVYHNSCNDSESKKWILRASKSKPGAFKIMSLRYGTCLHAASKTRAWNGRLNVYHRKCSDDSSDYFWLKQITEDSFQIISYKSGRCVHTSSSLGAGNGKQVYQHDCDENRAKLFSTNRLRQRVL